MKELHPDSAGDDPATLAAMARAMEIEDKPVVDVNGVAVGRVTRSFAESGMLLRADVTLDRALRERLAAPQDVVGVPAAWIASVEDEVRLSHAAEELLDAHPDTDDGGAPELPRKVR